LKVIVNHQVSLNQFQMTLLHQFKLVIISLQFKIKEQN